MDIYIDTANLDEIKRAADLGVLDGVTTNPSLVAREGVDFHTRLKEICQVVSGPVSAEVVATEAEAMIADLNEQRVFPRPVVTTIEPLTEFFPAEPYHQNYVCNNPNQGYVRGVALPKVDKVRKEFKDRLKDESPLDAPQGK